MWTHGAIDRLPGCCHVDGRWQDELRSSKEPPSDEEASWTTMRKKRQWSQASILQQSANNSENQSRILHTKQSEEGFHPALAFWRFDQGSDWQTHRTDPPWVAHDRRSMPVAQLEFRRIEQRRSQWAREGQKLSDREQCMSQMREAINVCPTWREEDVAWLTVDQRRYGLRLSSLAPSKKSGKVAPRRSCDQWHMAAFIFNLFCASNHIIGR